MGRPMTEITLPYVQQFRDRHGRMRYYVRRKGHKKVPLPGLPGSKAFMEAYQAALSTPEMKVSRAGPRSLSALIASFFKSAGFQNLSDSSKDTYRLVLKHIEAKDGHRGVADLPTDKAAKIIQEIGAERPAMAAAIEMIPEERWDLRATLTGLARTLASCSVGDTGWPPQR